MHTDEGGSAPPPPLAADAAGATAETEGKSVSQGVIVGIATAAVSFPLIYPAMWAAAWIFVGLLREARGGHLVVYGGRYWPLFNVIGGVLIGLIVTVIAGGLLVHYPFRKADPTAYFGVGALAMLPVAIFWGPRLGAGTSPVVLTLFIWLGSLGGLWIAASETRGAKRGRRRG